MGGLGGTSGCKTPPTLVTSMDRNAKTPPTCRVDETSDVGGVLYPGSVPRRGYSALRKHRVSIRGAEYFLTVCTKGRVTGLCELAMMSAIRREEARLEHEGVWCVRCAVVMPDHWHGLITLTGDVKLTDALKLFKGRLAPVMRRAGLNWQAGFYERRMRASEDRAPVFRYVFLNPFRTGLLPAGDVWPGYWCCETDWKWFEALTADGGVLPEWLG